VVDLIRADGFHVSEELYSFVEGNEPINMALTTANTIQHSASVLRRILPDWMITIADRYETLGTAIAAAYLGIPLIHVQGGEVSGNIDEKVRHAITKLADVHFVANQQARLRVERMGENPNSVFVTGCPSIDLAREAICLPIDLVQREIDEAGVGTKIDLSKDFIVVLQHPETESHDQSYMRMMMTLEMVQKLALPVLVFWPNVDAGSDATSKAIRVLRESGRLSVARYLKNLEGHLFLRLLKQSRCLVGNSSVGIRECAYIGTPVVNIGNRQAGRDRAENVLDCDWDRKNILYAIERQTSTSHYKSSDIYGNGYSGAEIARRIEYLSYAPKKGFHEI